MDTIQYKMQAFIGFFCITKDSTSIEWQKDIAYHQQPMIIFINKYNRARHNRKKNIQ